MAEFVIVWNLDVDRAFYEEINERLLHHPEFGNSNCLFQRTYKQTVQIIIKPLLGIWMRLALLM